MIKKKKSNNISYETSLQGFFFDQLKEINKKSAVPLSLDTIYYSSKVMDKFSLSKKCFEKIDGKLKTKLLESESVNKSKKKRILKDVGDSALFMCGFFPEHLNRKIMDISYYEEIGKIAYGRLNSLVPTVFDIDFFYKTLANDFNRMCSIISIVSKNVFEDSNISIVSSKIINRAS